MSDQIQNDVIATALVGVSISLPDGRLFYIHEGDTVKGLTYQPGNVGEPKTISGVVRCMDGILHSSKYHAHTTYPPTPWMYRYILPTAIIVDISEEKHAMVATVRVMDITNIEQVIPMPGTDGSISAEPDIDPVDDPSNGSDQDPAVGSDDEL